MRTIATLGPGEARALVCPWCGRTPARGDRAFTVVRDGRTIGALVLASAVPERDPQAAGLEATGQVDEHRVGVVRQRRLGARHQ